MADISKDDDEVVLERIMANGTFDELRKQLLEQIRVRNELLQASAERGVEQAMNHGGPPDVAWLR